MAAVRGRRPHGRRGKYDVVAERLHIPITDAGAALAEYARLHDEHLPDTARGVIDGTVNLSEGWD